MLISVLEFFGRLHPLIVHLPIGFLFLALILQALSRKRQYALPHAVLRLIWGLGLFFTLLACATGLLLSGEGGYDEETVTTHLWLGLGVAFLTLVIGYTVFRRKHERAFPALGICLFLVLTLTGHFGGSLTHGEEYLAAALDPSKEEAGATPVPLVSNVQEAHLYTDLIRPIFEAKCNDCHGAKKQKGRLRMDSPGALRKGGEDGPVLQPGKPEGSELVKRLLLPAEDKHHMPPKRKSQLSEPEIALVQWWIREGAPFDKKVGELSQPDALKPVLASFQERDQPAEKGEALVPEATVPPADPRVLERLKKRGIVVVPVSRNSNYLMASFVTVPEPGAEDLQLLQSLKEQLVWLRLNDTRIDDAGLKAVGACSALRMLQLNQTSITDKGLGHLSSLNELRSISLVGTAVTGTGLLYLRQLPHLEKIYVFRSGVTHQQWPGLRNAFPHAQIDTGGYQTRKLASDTTEVVFKKQE